MSDAAMNDSPDQEATPVLEVGQSPQSSPGTQLAARREALGLTVERVAEQLKMTPRQIMAIEADNYVALHGKAIYRGFVRAYAKVLRMESDALVAMIPGDAAIPINLTPASRNVLASFSETRFPAIGRRNYQSKWMMIAIALLALLIGVLVVQKMGWMPPLPQLTSLRGDSKSAESSAPASSDKPDSAASAIASSKEKTKQIDLPIVDVSSQLSSTPVVASSAAVIPAAPASTEAATVEPATPESAVAPQVAAVADVGNMLVLQCREESWVEVRRTNGSVLFSGRIPAGTTESIEISEPVQLTLGNGPGVDATLRGASLVFKSEAGSKVVRLNLK